MDPLTISTAVLTIAGSVTASLRLAQKTTDAPQELVTLVEDVTSLEPLLGHIELVCRTSSHSDEAYPTTLSDLLQRASNILFEVDHVLRTRLLRRRSEAGAANTMARRIPALRALPRLRELQQSLASVKLNLTVMLGVIAASESRRTTQVVKKITGNEGLIVEASRLQRLSADTSEKMLHDILQHVAHISDHLILPSSTTSEESTICGDAAPASPGILRRVSSAESASIQSRETRDGRLGAFVDRTLVSAVPQWSTSAMPVREACDPKCGCRCHSIRRMSSPACLQVAFGQLNIEYVAPPMLRGSCNIKSCKTQASPAARIAYFFPPWFLLRTLLATVVLPGLQAMRLDLRAPRTVPKGSAVLEYARRGDLAGVRSLFESRLASIYDIDVETGASALTYAIDGGHVELWRYLLGTGADPYQLNRGQQAAIDNAVNKFLANVYNADINRAIKEDFDTVDYLQEKRFSGLHMIILGLLAVPLTTQLGATNVDIDERDWQGRTGLSWAASRGNASFVSMLLEHNADPNIRSHNGSSPLHFAARASNPKCVALLVNAGANIHDENLWKIDALIYAMRASDEVERICPLVMAGAKLNRPIPDGAVFLATRESHPKQLAYVLQHGATLTEHEVDKTLALGFSKRNLDVLRLLLDHIVERKVDFNKDALRRLAFESQDTTLIRIVYEAIHWFKPKTQGPKQP